MTADLFSDIHRYYTYTICNYMQWLQIYHHNPSSIENKKLTVFWVPTALDSSKLGVESGISCKLDVRMLHGRFWAFCEFQGLQANLNLLTGILCISASRPACSLTIDASHSWLVQGCKSKGIALMISTVKRSSPVLELTPSHPTPHCRAGYLLNSCYSSLGYYII